MSNTAIDPIRDQGHSRPFNLYNAARRFFPWAVLLLVAAMVFAPIFSLVVGAFSLARLPNEFSMDNMGFGNFYAVWVEQRIDLVLWNTAVYVTGATIFGIGTAAILAWLVERSDMPGKIWIYAGVPLGIAVPGILHAIAWVLLLSPRSGFINRSWMYLTGAEEPLFTIYSMTGLIFAEGLRLVPVAFLMLVPLMRSMDPSLEEAAAASGASPMRTVRRVTFALLLPGVLAISIFQAITAMENFEVPGILGLPVNIHVFSTRVFNLIDNIGAIPAFGQANAAAVFYLGIALVISFFYLRLVRHSERYSIITGKGYTPRAVRLGAWRYPAAAMSALFLFVTIVLPFLVLLYVSLVGYLRQPSLEAFQSFSFKHYLAVFEQPRVGRVLWNTIFLTVMTSTAVTILSFVIAYIVVRTRFSARYTLDVLAFMPHSIPGIVLGLALFWLLIQFDSLTGASSFGSLYSLVIGFTILFLAYAVRAMSVAMIQVHPDLEDAAMLCGAPPWRVAVRIFAPLLMPTLVGIWIYVAMLSVRFISLPLILSQGGNNEVLGVMIWSLWDNGNINSVGAIGIMLMTVMFGFALSLRVFGFGQKNGGGAL
ncbi:ABC-type Fe3+ transport system, permease component [Hoeflea sp. IMCC20628]|uniref:ABC transporter permease n=1 Tax=Hoeflea sp. IMCC20628 TaxID=1620421 RepID=UPI00063AC1C8|nr:iron ABC transporter permease [Hoeflea sp. IMCC20628]AKI01935.1 ABC-type Fe3+ transport system, permease component [Hoeflea sp. IMCC20628]